jgi:hypothetical protein
MRDPVSILIPLAVALAVTLPAPAAAIVLEARAVGCAGGAASGGALVLGFTAGLPVAGSAQNLFTDQILGFWRWGPGAPAGAGDGAGLPAFTALHPNRPNPFHGSTEFVFQLATEAGAVDCVRLDVYDVAGRLVRRVVDTALPAGVYRAAWDGRNAQGQNASAGVYFARFTAGAATETRRIVLGH